MKLDIFGLRARAEREALKKAVFRLNRKLQESNAFTLEQSTSASAHTGNRYNDEQAGIAEVKKKYLLTSSWGCRETANIIDFRAAMIVGDGINITSTDERAQEFIDQFIDLNRLDFEAVQEWIINGEIEGRFMARLEIDRETGNVRVNPVSWLKNRYKVDAESRAVQRIFWTDGGGKVVELKPGEACFARFGGDLFEPNVSPPKILRCLTQIEDLDRAFWDWREIDHLYGSPVPVFECSSEETAAEVNRWLEETGGAWQLRKAIALVGKLTMVGPDMAGVAAIEKEIVRLACFISGSTGYPIQFLLPDMMSNRATAENIMESAVAHTARERETWRGFFYDLTVKAIALYNKANSKSDIDPGTVSVAMPRITAEAWNRLTAFWLPARTAGIIDDETFYGQIPGFDVSGALEKAEAKDMALQKEIADDIDNATTEAVGFWREEK